MKIHRNRFTFGSIPKTSCGKYNITKEYRLEIEEFDHKISEDKYCRKCWKVQLKGRLRQLKYCPRVKHSMDLSRPTIRCRQLGMNCNLIREECAFFPNLKQYCEVNHIKVTFDTRFRCIIFDKK